jgi:transcriptional regulator with PAS, ATPase and Fis domain
VGATSVRRVDARVVAATNRDLPAAVAARTFREDLYYRINAITVHLPPLRERVPDVTVLAEHFLAEAAREFGRRFQGIATETAGLLERYQWPGNVRELRAVISRAALLHDDDRMRPLHLPSELVSAALTAPATTAEPTEGVSAIPTLEEVELGHIRRVLDICAGNRTLAAQHLGITRQTLSKRLGGD